MSYACSGDTSAGGTCVPQRSLVPWSLQRGQLCLSRPRPLLPRGPHRYSLTTTCHLSAAALHGCPAASLLQTHLFINGCPARSDVSAVQSGHGVVPAGQSQAVQPQPRGQHSPLGQELSLDDFLGGHRELSEEDEMGRAAQGAEAPSQQAVKGTPGTRCIWSCSHATGHGACSWEACSLHLCAASGRLECASQHR